MTQTIVVVVFHIVHGARNALPDQYVAQASVHLLEPLPPVVDVATIVRNLGSVMVVVTLSVKICKLIAVVAEAVATVATLMVAFLLVVMIAATEIA